MDELEEARCPFCGEPLGQVRAVVKRLNGGPVEVCLECKDVMDAGGDPEDEGLPTVTAPEPEPTAGIGIAEEVERWLKSL